MAHPLPTEDLEHVLADAPPLVRRQLDTPALHDRGNYRISGDLTNTDKVMNNTFWIGVQPALTREMLKFAAAKIESYLGVNF